MKNVAVTTFEATVFQGQIRLPESISLPENTRVYVVVPDAPSVPPSRVLSPRLADPQQAVDFVKEVLPVQ